MIIVVLLEEVVPHHKPRPRSIFAKHMRGQVTRFEKFMKTWREGAAFDYHGVYEEGVEAAVAAYDLLKRYNLKRYNRVWKSVMQEVHNLAESHRTALDKFRSPKPHYNLPKFVLQKVEWFASLSCSLCNTNARLYCNV